MCKIPENIKIEIARQYALDNEKKTAKKLIQGGIPIKRIARYAPMLSMDDLKEMEAKFERWLNYQVLVKGSVGDFSCTGPDGTDYEARYGKEITDIRNKAALDNTRETAERMIKDNKMTLGEIMRYIPLSYSELNEMEAQLLKKDKSFRMKKLMEHLTDGLYDAVTDMINTPTAIFLILVILGVIHLLIT